MGHTAALGNRRSLSGYFHPERGRTQFGRGDTDRPGNINQGGGGGGGRGGGGGGGGGGEPPYRPTGPIDAIGSQLDADLVDLLRTLYNILLRLSSGTVLPRFTHYAKKRDRFGKRRRRPSLLAPNPQPGRGCFRQDVRLPACAKNPRWRGRDEGSELDCMALWAANQLEPAWERYRNREPRHSTARVDDVVRLQDALYELARRCDRQVTSFVYMLYWLLELVFNISGGNRDDQSDDDDDDDDYDDDVPGWGRPKPSGGGGTGGGGSFHDAADDAASEAPTHLH